MIRYLAIAVIGCASTSSDPAVVQSDSAPTQPVIADAGTAASAPDPSALPPLHRQVVDWDGYRALGVISAPANMRYADPRSGVPVTKMTSASVPAVNANAVNDYTEGGPYISREWAPGWHTVIVRVDNVVWLADYHRGSGASNWRRITGDASPQSPVTAGFSMNPATPRMLWFLRDAKLYRYDTATMTLIGSRVVSNTTGGHLDWLQISRNDDFIVFQQQNIGRIFAYDRNHDVMAYRDFLTLDEPHLDRDGRFVMAVDGGGGASTSPWGRAFHIWDLATNQTFLVEDVHNGHVAWVRGYLVGLDPDPTALPPFYFDPIAKVRHYTGHYSELSSLHPTHHAAQWLQATTDASQWYYGTNDNHIGSVTATGWSAVTGSIYSSAINWGPTYEKPAVGVHAVYQVAADRVDHTLTEVSSVAAMSQGSFYYDAAAQRIYAWAFGGGAPGTRLLLFAQTSLHWGIGLRRVDGSDARFLCHDYAVNNTYWETPFGTTSPDGKLVMFHSNMGLAHGRMDVFVVEVPLAP